MTNGTPSLDDDLVRKSKAEKDANSHKYSDEIGKAKKNIKIWSYYLGSLIVAIIIVVVVAYCLSLIEYPWTKEIYIGIISTAIGALLAKKW